MSQTDVHYIHVLLKHAARTGLSPEKLLHRTGLGRQTLEFKRSVDISSCTELIRRL